MATRICGQCLRNRDVRAFVEDSKICFSCAPRSGRIVKVSTVWQQQGKRSDSTRKLRLEVIRKSETLDHAAEKLNMKRNSLKSYMHNNNISMKEIGTHLNKNDDDTNDR